MIGLVFSRDRAMQLDGTLQSFFLHVQDADDTHLHVIFKATTAQHARQYACLAKTHAARVRFIEQRKFRRDVLQVLLPPSVGKVRRALQREIAGWGSRAGFINNLALHIDQTDQVLFLVDDNLFVRDFSLHAASEALATHQDTLGFSLRLGPNITHYYMLNRPQKMPSCSRIAQDMLKFCWRDAEYDFAYPLEISSSIFRVCDVLPILHRIPFANPNTLEGHLALHAPSFRNSRPYLLCFDPSVAFCNPINIVQTEYANRAGEHPGYTVNSLAQMFDEGYRIDVTAYSGFVPSACHQEQELVFASSEAQVT